MMQILLTFLSAFLLSGIAGYYSIVGLALIFPGAFWPVVAMGASLEFSKLVTASWLYRNWKTAPILLKSYLTIAVIILMLITSMGIFGFLSKSHIEHSTESAPIVDKVSMYDEEINTRKQQIEENKKAIKQMDDSVEQLMGRTSDDKGVNRAVQVRKSQQKERTRLTNNNLQLQKEIAKLNTEKTPMMVELRKTEADIGPIKYVAEIVYGKSEQDIIDKAVRLVIMIIMLVFDPLAVLLLIAGNISLGIRKNVQNGTLYPNQYDDLNLLKPKKRNSPKKTKVNTQSNTVEVDTKNITEFMQEPVNNASDTYYIDHDEKIL
jgi:hypothetical protein